MIAYKSAFTYVCNNSRISEGLIGLFFDLYKSRAILPSNEGVVFQPISFWNRDSIRARENGTKVAPVCRWSCEHWLRLSPDMIASLSMPGRRLLGLRKEAACSIVIKSLCRRRGVGLVRRST